VSKNTVAQTLKADGEGEVRASITRPRELLARLGRRNRHDHGRECSIGTLVVDLFDTPSKKLIWRGQASDVLSDKPEKNDKKLG